MFLHRILSLTEAGRPYAQYAQHRGVSLENRLFATIFHIQQPKYNIPFIISNPQKKRKVSPVFISYSGIHTLSCESRSIPATTRRAALAGAEWAEAVSAVPPEANAGTAAGSRRNRSQVKSRENAI